MNKYDYQSEAFWNWVASHKDKNVAQLLLGARQKDAEVDIDGAIRQIECRIKYGKKFDDTLSRFPKFYFPSGLSAEQATSDMLAAFHSSLVRDDDVLADLTAGLGIDVLHLAAKVKKAVAVERDRHLAEALRYNAEGLGITNLTVFEGDSRSLINELSGTVAFIDPARRAADGSRVFGLEDCEPDILEMLATLQNNFGRVLIKASPMLDITHTVNQLKTCSDIYAVGTTTECKELLVLVRSNDDFDGTVTVHAVTVFPGGDVKSFSFERADEAAAKPLSATRMPKAGDLLYVPYPSVMKTAPVKLLSERFNLFKFHENTHLYFSEAGLDTANFPGEIFNIVDVVPWQSKNLKRFKNVYPHIAVSARNFGMSAEALRQKLGVKEGGSAGLRLFGIGLGKNHTDRLLVVAGQQKR